MEEDMIIYQVAGFSDKAKNKILAHKEEIYKRLILSGALDYGLLYDFVYEETYGKNVFIDILKKIGIDINIEDISDDDFETLLNEFQDIIEFCSIDSRNIEPPTIDEWKATSEEITDNKDAWKVSVENFIETYFECSTFDFSTLAEKYVQENLENFYTWLMKDEKRKELLKWT